MYLLYRLFLTLLVPAGNTFSSFLYTTTDLKPIKNK